METRKEILAKVIDLVVDLRSELIKLGLKDMEMSAYAIEREIIKEYALLNSENKINAQGDSSLRIHDDGDSDAPFSSDNWEEGSLNSEAMEKTTWDESLNLEYRVNCMRCGDNFWTNSGTIGLHPICTKCQTENS